MKTVFIAFYEAYPPSSGAASVTYNYAKHACGKRWLIQVGPREDEQTVADDLRVITLPGKAGRLGKITSLRRLIGRITQLCCEIEPDVIVLEGASWVVYHLLLLRKLRRTVADATIVYHAHNVEYLLRAAKHGRTVTALTRQAEGRLLRRVDAAYAVSEPDRKLFAEHYGVDTGILPNGVDVALFDEIAPEVIAQMRHCYGLNEESVLFMGFYAYQPNREAVDFLVQHVFPLVVEQRPQARLIAIGSEIPYRRPWLINPGVLPHEQLPPFIKACAVGTAPIFSGSGTRLKILEYLAAGLPVVATAKGAEGLDLADRRSLLLAEGAESFAQGIIELLDNRTYAQELAAHGHQVVRNLYGYPAILSRFCHELTERTLASTAR